MVTHFPSPASQLVPDSVHIWLKPLKTDDEDAVITTARSLLAPAELAHGELFTQTAARHRYFQVRTFVRECLAGYAGQPPQELIFEKTPQGKPLLANAALSFNLSHTGELLALAISRELRVGIDLEPVSTRRNWRGIAERYFHREEFAALMAWPEPCRTQAFYRWWTLKEAFLKARGTGIATGLEKAVFSFDATQIHHRFLAELGEDQHAWQFHQWHYEPDCYLALACSQPASRPLTIQFYRADDGAATAAPLQVGSSGVGGAA